jgi:type 1 glutamine amidotransferase
MKRMMMSLVVVLLVYGGVCLGQRKGDPSAAALAKIRAAAPKQATAKPKRTRKMLVLSYQSHEEGRFAGEKALEIMARQTGAYTMEIVSNKADLVAAMMPANLKKYDAVCVNNSTGGDGKANNGKTLVENLSDYVAGGGGLVGIHSATDNKFGEVFGGFFSGHPWSETVGVKIDDPDHTLCKVFDGQGFMVDDEIYQFTKIYTREKLRVLLSLDMAKTKDKGKRADKDNAVAWVKQHGKGRVFYCSLGHKPHVFQDPKLLRFYLDGIQFALGDIQADMTPSATLIVDKYTGEYTGALVIEGKEVRGLAQVIAEGNGKYRVALMQGLWQTDPKLDQFRVELSGTINNEGNVPLAGDGWTGTLVGRQTLTVKSGSGKFEGKWTVRRSPTLGAKPPQGAIVLLPFEPGKAPSLDEWSNKKWKTLKTGAMEVRGGTTFSVRKFGSAKFHVEFRCPYEPTKRGQGRGNSGVYLQRRYEVQVLESFGLKSQSNDCGSIYKVANTKLNACLPPLQWQTYDIEFQAAKTGPDGKPQQPTMTVYHNGIEIHKDVKLPGKTTAAAASGNIPKDSLMLQDHGNKVRYRNIWVEERD